MVKNNFIPDFDRIQNYQLCVEPYNQSQPTEQSNSSESKSSEVHMGDSQGPVVVTTALMEQTSTPYTNAKRLSAVKESRSLLDFVVSFIF